ncbi:MAG: site-specific integrase [Thermodesulfobacteriota bacterium]
MPTELDECKKNRQPSGLPVFISLFFLPRSGLVQQFIRRRFCSFMAYRTEKNYIYWMKRYIFFHHKRHPKDMEVQEIEAFLTHLAVQELLGHKDVSTTMIYNHVLRQKGIRPVKSPLDD